MGSNGAAETSRAGGTGARVTTRRTFDIEQGGATMAAHDIAQAWAQCMLLVLCDPDGSQQGSIAVVAGAVCAAFVGMAMPAMATVTPWPQSPRATAAVTGLRSKTRVVMRARTERIILKVIASRAINLPTARSESR